MWNAKLLRIVASGLDTPNRIFEPVKAGLRFRIKRGCPLPARFAFKEAPFD
jgi:hypothetical protein